jgi:hypothetical protein
MKKQLLLLSQHNYMANPNDQPGAELVISKQAKPRALSLLAWACLTEIVRLACLLGRLIDFA